MGTGVYCFKPGSGWEQLGQGAAFSQILVNCLTSDKDGTLWVGLDGAQVDQVSPRPVTTLHLPTNAAQNTIRMVCTSRDGSLWVGTDGAGVFRYREGTWKQFSQDEGLLNGYVGVIFEDRRTNLWVGTWDGLFLLRGEEFRRALSARSSQLVVRAMYQDAGEDLWVGTSSAVVQLRDLKIINGTNGYLDGQVMTIEQDGSGVIWAAVSGRGLYQLVEGRFERSKSEPWGSLVEITALLPDADGGMWLGSLYNGLAYTKDGASRTWTTRDGLPSDGIRALVEDSEGNLWCSSDNGIFGCPKSRLLNYQPGQGPPILFWQLSVADGLDTRRCSGQGQPVAARSVDGRLWFPNWRALAVFDPACVPQSRAVRPPLVEETIVDGTAASPAADGVVRVKSAARSYEFHYSSPTFSSPERLRFRYRLQGWDRDWTEAGQRRVAFYNHLAPGRYEFHVAVGGADGAWHEVVQGHQLEVMPHFLERRSVQVAGALVLLVTGAAIVWAVARVRLQRRLAQIESAQAMERERRRIARDLHDDLGAGLAEVVLLGEVARQNNVPADELQAHVSDMTEKSRRLVTAMDEIVWTVNPRNDSIPNLTSYVAEHARKFFAPTSIHCRLDIPPELPSLPLPAAVRHSLFLAIKEALHNVVKHSAAREVWLRMHWAAGEFTIQVQDDGRGFALNEQSEGRDGLTNLRQRLESVGGRADITSSPGQGTAVKLTLPVIGMNGGA
jgi:signal transduction histidine kinase/streptogramin lyase